jgi:hypothetical protein
MKKVAQNALLLLPLGGIALPALGQAVPAATTQAPYQGFMLPTVGGSLQWAVSASETVTVGYNGSGGTAASTNFSGDVAYISASENHPFSMIYTGGELISDTGNEPNSFFSDLALSQVWKTKNWVFIGSDTVSYLPDSPTTGLSGVLGVGDLGNTPVTSSLGQDILTTNNPRVDNAVSGSVVRTLTGATSLHATGSYEVLRFLDDTNDAIDSNQVGASAGIEHRINARNSIGASYAYSSFTYETGTFSFITQSVFLDYTREWTKQLTMSATIGPQRASSSSSPTSPGYFTPSVNVGGSLLLSYQGQRTNYSLSYLRSENGGSGISQGALSDSVSFNVRRPLNRVWQVAGTALYSRSSSLPNLAGTSYTTDGEVASGQLSRGIGRSLSAFLSYAVERQTETGLSSSTAVFNGTSQVIGFGITYSPSAHTLNRK